jgi:LysM repeat protein
MSEQAPEAPVQQRPSGGKLGVWGRKYGPLPGWGWAAILLAIILVVMWYRNKNSAANTNVGSATAAGTTGASQIPEFVNQTYTTVTPPSEPTTTAPPPPVVTPGNQIPGHHVVTANGTETLQQIASKYGTTPADIIAFTKAHKPHVSPTEAKFFSKPSGKVPKGILLWVPEPQVTNITGPGGGESG